MDAPFVVGTSVRQDEGYLNSSRAIHEKHLRKLPAALQPIFLRCKRILTEPEWGVLGFVTPEQRCAALGMQLEGQHVNNIVAYLLDAATQEQQRQQRSTSHLSVSSSRGSDIGERAGVGASHIGNVYAASTNSISQHDHHHYRSPTAAWYLDGRNGALARRVEQQRETSSSLSSSFLHRYKTTMCPSYVTTGRCAKGASCHLAHGDRDKRTFEMNVRDGLTCDSAALEFQTMAVKKARDRSATRAGSGEGKATSSDIRDAQDVVHSCSNVYSNNSTRHAIHNRTSVLATPPPTLHRRAAETLTSRARSASGARVAQERAHSRDSSVTSCTRGTRCTTPSRFHDPSTKIVALPLKELGTITMSRKSPNRTPRGANDVAVALDYTPEERSRDTVVAGQTPSPIRPPCIKQRDNPSPVAIRPLQVAAATDPEKLERSKKSIFQGRESHRTFQPHSTLVPPLDSAHLVTTHRSSRTSTSPRVTLVASNNNDSSAVLFEDSSSSPAAAASAAHSPMRRAHSQNALARKGTTLSSKSSNAGDIGRQRDYSSTLKPSDTTAFHNDVTEALNDVQQQATMGCSTTSTQPPLSAATAVAASIPARASAPRSSRWLLDFEEKLSHMGLDMHAWRQLKPCEQDELFLFWRMPQLQISMIQKERPRT